jgi:hypothetical protein
MADISRIVDLYDLYNSYRRVAIKEVQDGVADEILPQNRGIIQPSRVFTEPVRQKIHKHLESNNQRLRDDHVRAEEKGYSNFAGNAVVS